MVFLNLLIACHPAPIRVPHPGRGEPISDDFDFDDAEHDCEVVAAAAADVPTEWDALDAASLLGAPPTAVSWTYTYPGGAEGDVALHLDPSLGASTWVTREGREVGSTGCRDGVELAVDVSFTWDVDAGGATGSGDGVVYVAGPEAEHLYFDDYGSCWDSEVSEEWQVAAEAYRSTEYGVPMTFESGRFCLSGAWADARVDVGGKFDADSDIVEGGSTSLRSGAWADLEE